MDNKENQNVKTIIDNQDKSKKLFNNIFGKIYSDFESKLSLIKESTQNYFDNIPSECAKNYQDFQNKFHSYFLKKADIMKNALGIKDKENEEEELDEKTISEIQNYTKTIIDNFNSIIKTYEVIFDNIKENMKILLKFLTITTENLEEKNPVHFFLDKEIKNILNNWLFIKLTFEDYNIFNLVNNNLIDDQFKDLCFKVCDNKLFSIDISDQYQNQTISSIYKISQKYISSIKLQNIDSWEICSDTSEYVQLKSLYLKDITKLPKKDIFCHFDKVNKLKLEKCNIIKFKNLDFLDCIKSFNNLIEIYFENSNLINNDFNMIFSEYLMKNENTKKNLEVLSFKNNHLNKIDINQLVFQQKNKFYSLRELNFSKNNIYKFEINPEFFPKLIVINLCYNKFTYSKFKKYKDIIVLQSGNLFLMQEEFYKNYYTKFIEKINTTSSKLNKIYLSYIPKSFSEEYLPSIKISNSVLMNLLSLDLSYNHMNCDIFFSFIKNNKTCLNIRKINLNGNELDDTFFEKYIDNKYNELFYNLESIKMSNNLIGNDVDINYKDDEPIPEYLQKYEKLIYKLRLIYNFIEKNKNLTKFYITRNPISEKFIIEACDKKDIEKKIKKDENGNIIINCFYTFLLKIKKELRTPKLINNKNGVDIRYDCNKKNNQDIASFNIDNNNYYISFNNN